MHAVFLLQAGRAARERAFRGALEDLISSLMQGEGVEGMHGVQEAGGFA